MATRRTSRKQVGGSRYSYGARVVPVAAPARTATSSSSRSDPAYIAAQIRNVVEARDHQALNDLNSGKLIPFITYARARITYAQDDADRQRWTKLLGDAEDKAEENAMAAGVAAGEIDLEEAEDFLRTRRDRLEPSDPRFTDLTEQISDVKNAIQARDFNAELNTAIAEMIESGSTVAAKEKYLQTLIRILPRAKDPKAQETIRKQMADLHDSIVDDRITARSTETSAKLVAYYNGNISGAEMQNFLQQKADTALSEQEARAYATAASQVATRERTAQTARVRAAASGGAGSVSAAVTKALAPLTKSTADAIAAFSATTKRTGVPDAKAFATLKEAAQIELDTIEQSLSSASPAAAEALIKRREALLTSVNTAQRAAATKTVQAEKDRTAAFNDTLETLRKQGAPYEETAKLAAQRVATVKAAQAMPWMVGYEDDPTLGGDLASIEQKTRKMLTDEAAVQTGLLTGETPITKKLKGEYERYRGYFVAKGVETPLGLDEWLRAMTDEQDPASLSDILKLPKADEDIRALRVEQDNIRRMRQERHVEVQVAADRLIAAAYPRTDTGARVDYNAALPGEGAAGNRFAYFDPTRNGQFDPNIFGPLTAAHARGGPQEPFDPAQAGAGVVAPPNMDPLAGGGGGKQASLAEEEALDAHERAARAAARAAMDPHDAADDFLSEETDFKYPTWEIPALPDWGAFASGGNSFDAGYVEEYSPPPLPAYAAPSFSLPSLPNIDYAQRAGERSSVPAFEPPPMPLPAAPGPGGGGAYLTE